MLPKALRLFTSVVVFLLALPLVFGSVGIELGDALYNTDIIRASDFTAHSGGFSACITDQVTIPLRITNTNAFSELYTLSVDDQNVLLSSSQAALKSKQTGIITLTLPADSFSAANATLLVNIASRRESVERNFALAIAYEDCFGFSVAVVSEEPSYCGCESVAIQGEVVNEGEQSDSYLVEFEGDAWLSSSFAIPTVDLEPDGAGSFVLGGSVPCVGEDEVSFSLDVTSGGSGVSKVLSKSYEVVAFSSCYDTRVAVMDVLVDYSGKEVPVKVSNNGLRAASYSLSLEGISWYVASLDAFTLAPGQSTIVTLYLQPDSAVEEGVYDATLLLESDVFDAERDIQITVKEQSRVASSIQYYASFFRYYWLLVIAVFVLWMVFSHFRGGNVEKSKVKEKKFSKDENKKAFKEISPKKVKRISSIIYFVFIAVVLLGFLVTATAYFLNRAGTETFLPQPSSLVVNIFIGALILVIVLPIVTALLSRVRKKGIVTVSRAGKKVEQKKVLKEVKKEIVKEVKRFGDWVLVISVFVVIVVAIALFELIRTKRIPVLNEFLLVYYPYIIAGFVILVVLIAVLVSLEKRKKKKK